MRVALVAPETQIPAVLLAYDAAARPEQWQAFVDTLSVEFDDAAVSLLLSVGGDGQSCVAVQSGLDEEFAAQWWLGSTRETPRAACASGEVRFRFGDAVGRWFDRRLAPTPSLVVDLPREEGDRAGLAIISRSGRRALDQRDLARSQELVPHLVRALRIRDQIQGEVRRQRWLSELLDRQQTGLLLLDANGRCVYSNAAARRVVALDDGLIFEKGHLEVADRNAQRAYLAAVSDAANHGNGRECETHVLIVERPSHLAPFNLSISPIVPAPGERCRAVLAVHVSDPTDEVDAQVLRAQYGLTSSEAALATLLATGHSLAESAARRGIGIGTARGYLKSLCRKTRTHGQREIVRLILTGVAPIASARASSVSAIQA